MKKPVQYRNRLKQHPVVYNLVLIAGLLLAMAIVAHVAMRIGTRHGARRAVPDFTGLPLEKAHEVARQNDLDLFINDSLFVPAYDGGIVLDQLPEQGVGVKPGRTVYVTINSYKQKMVEVPYVAGRSLRQAKNMLEIGGLGIEELIFRADIATNYVLEEYFEGRPIGPESRVQAEMGSGVTLYVGVEGGYGTTVVPQLVGRTLREAKSRLWETGLNVGKVSFDPGVNLLNQKEARVYMQSPDAERGVQLGAKVELRLTLDTEKVAASRNTAEKLAKAVAEQRLQEEREQADSLEAAGAALPGAEPAVGESPDETRNDDNGFFD